MAEAVKIPVEVRDAAKNKGTGSRVSRKLRAKGRIPAIVYGHKQAPVPISVPKDAVLQMIKAATHLAELQMSGGTETVLIKDVQWDHLGKEILHLDFARVNAEETVEAEIRLDIKGDAPGVAEGGVLEVVHHTITVTCRAVAIPDAIKVDVSELHLGGAIHVKEIKLPAGVVIVGDGDQVAIHVINRVVEPEPVVEETQPEVIKPERKDKED